MIDEQMNEMAEAFLRWSLPEDVCADAIACTPRAPHRTGTNLLTARQAVEMIKFVCGPELAVMHAEARDAKAHIAELEAENKQLGDAYERNTNAAMQLRDRAERAEAALRELGKHPEECDDDSGACVSHLAYEDCKAELAAARADAARYRWLRQNGSDSRVTEKDGFGGYCLKYGYDLDAAIDAARGGEG